MNLDFFPVFLGLHNPDHRELAAEEFAIRVADFYVDIVEVRKDHETLSQRNKFANLNLEKQLVKISGLELVVRLHVQHNVKRHVRS